MSAVILGIVAIVIIAVVILLSLNYKNTQSLKCPSCQLDFTTDLFFLGQNTLVSCPFCHRWMVVSRVSNRNFVKKLFEGQHPREERGPNE
ncbi:hypothetical protein MUP77_20020 [Candidatus Bathyarchaeota archaeon]|nr:hypothetical protein [Candidatus Bathyarchaeota archaeon]